MFLEHDPTRKRELISDPDPSHVSSANIAWYMNFLAGTAPFEMDPDMEDEISSHLQSCSLCERELNRLDGAQYDVTYEEILEGRLRTSI